MTDNTRLELMCLCLQMSIAEPEHRKQWLSAWQKHLNKRIEKETHENQNCVE